jgi:hypothetical protein
MKQNIQLYAQGQGLGTGNASFILLDLYDSEPIKLSKSVQGLEDPQVTKSTFSRTFRIPNTAANGQYFKAVFNVNTTDFNAAVKANAYINVDGYYFTSGNVRLLNIVRNDRTGKIEYEIVFMGETSNFGAVIGPRNLSDLNLSAYSHNITYTNVQNSWNLQLFGGDIVYPLAEYGYTYDNNGIPIQSTLSVYNGTTSQKGFTNSANPLLPQQFKPAIKVKAIWDKIFEEAGFTYTSDFINETLFDKLYYLSSNEALPTFNPEVKFECNGFTPEVAYESSIGPTTLPLELPVATIDPSNSVKVSPLDYYQAAFTGNPYIFRVEDIYPSVLYRSPYAGSAPYFTTPVQIQLLVNGAVTSSQTGYLPVPQSIGMVGQPISIDPQYDPTTTTFIFSVALQEDDQVSIQFRFETGFYRSFEVLNATFSGSGPSVVNPAGLLPTTYKQVDFIRGINDRFKLVWEPDPENATNFYIEPWRDWILDGTQYDWSNKLDETKDIKIDPLFYTQPRKINFRDSKEGDLYNVLYENQKKLVFGELEQDSNLEVITGEKTIASFFAPTPLAPIPGDNGFIIPHFAKDTETERQPIEVKPRLLFYNGKHSPGSSVWYMRNDAGTAVAQTTYPLVSQFDKFPFDSQSFDLNWTNVQQYWNRDDTGFDGRTNFTSFSQYWSNWFAYTYDPYSRIMEASFMLYSEEIRQLRFNDKIFVKDSWWLVQEIKDFVLNSLQSCRVKLLKLGNNVGYAVGIPDPALTKIYYRHTGLCFSPEGDSCSACCCSEQTGITVFTTTPNLIDATQFFLDKGGVIFASEGFYSDGTDSFQIGPFGGVLAIGTCSVCNCTPTGLQAISVVQNTVLCTACCASSFPTTVYHNGATGAVLGDPGITKLYSGASGGTLLANNWYKQSASNIAVRLGADANTISVNANCNISCSCDPLPAEFPNAKLGSGTGGTAMVCCPEIYVPTATVYADTFTYGSATGYFYDPYRESPVGPSPEYAFGELITGVGGTSAELQFVEVQAAVPIAYGICTEALSTSVCDRTESVNGVFLVNTSGSFAELNYTFRVSNEVQLDPTFYSGNAFLGGTGPGIVDTQQMPYSQGAYMSFEYGVSGATAGATRVRVFAPGSSTAIFDPFPGTTGPLTGSGGPFGPIGISPATGGSGIVTQWVVAVNYTP